MPASPDPLRTHLLRLLDWEEAHVGFDRAVAGVPRELRGVVPQGFRHSAWQLLEHIRLAQRDLLDFAVNAAYVHDLTWPDDYWPRDPMPVGGAWEAAVAAVVRDRDAVKTLVSTPTVDLFALVPTGSDGQTVLRAVLLVADHASYHVGQLVSVRQALGCWP
jgi:hypothetical protein